ncbi:MAG: DUF309 domain-containing protein [Holophagaceae bacterium]
MSCSDTRPLFWQRQPVLPLEVQRFLRELVEAALDAPRNRALLAWPTVLGAPKLREAHPGGLPEPLLLELAARMLGALGVPDPASAWSEARSRLPGLAQEGPDGWRPGAAWGAFGPLASLRCGVALSALTGLPEDGTYRLQAAVALFDVALFHETHDALEALWIEAEGALRAGLQGLILLAAGYHHQQLHNLAGAVAVWEDALERLGPCEGLLATPWGHVDHREALQFTEERLAYLQADPDAAPEALWAMPVPRWEIRP